MALSEKDCAFERGPEGLTYLIKFKVKKKIIDDENTYYEGISEDGSLQRYLSNKKYQTGFGGSWFKFELEDGTHDMVKGPFHDNNHLFSIE